jgi:hypothetical protein
MLVATCALTAAGFGRFPESILPAYLFHAGVDLLILLGVARQLNRQSRHSPRLSLRPSSVHSWADDRELCRLP